MASKSRTNLDSLTNSLLAVLEQSRAKQMELIAENRVHAAKQHRERLAASRVTEKTAKKTVAQKNR